MDAVSSGWMRTYEIIFGELEEAKANFTALTEILWTVFASGAEHRNEMLKWLKEAGGISNVFQGFKNTAVSLLKVLKPISAAFDQIFPPKTKEQWLEITEAFKDFTATLLITDETASKIQRTFAGVFAVLDIGWQVLKFLGSAALEIIKIFIPLGDGALGASASLGDFLVRINELLKSSQLLQYSLLAVKVGVALFRNGLKNVTGIVKEFVLELWTAEKPFEFLANAGSKVFNGLIDNIKMAASWLIEKLTKAFQSAVDLFSKTEDDGKKGFWAGVLDILKNIVTFIGGEASKAFTDFGSSIKNLDLNKVATFVVGGVLLIFVKQISDLTGAMTSLTTATSGAINALTKKFLGYKTTTNIRDMGYALGILTASIWVLSTIPAEDLKKSLIGLSVAIGTFVAAYGMITGIQVAASKLMKNTEMVSTGFGLVGVAAAMVVMSMALKIIAGIEGSLGPAFLVITGLVGLVSAYQVLAVLISKIPDQKEVVFNLVGLSASILALAAAVMV